MKIGKCWPAIIALGLVLGAAGAHANAPDPGGFARAAWASSEKECARLNVCTEQPLAVPDVVANEKVLVGGIREIGGVPVTRSALSFYNNRLYLGSAFFDSRRTSFDELKGALVKAHGAPKSTGPRGAAWLLGKTRIILHQGERFHGVVYAHIPTMNEVAKLKGYPQPPPPPAPPAKKKK